VLSSSLKVRVAHRIAKISTDFLSLVTSFSYDDSKLDGPSRWGSISSTCDGTQQSPVDIKSRFAPRSVSCTPLTIFNLNVPSKSIHLSNTGHGASFELFFDNGVQVQMFGGPLREVYELHTSHLHWPSEHTLDGKRFAGEIHLVHFNKKYGSFNRAATMADGLAVLGFFIEVDDKMANKRATRYIKLFKTVREPFVDDINIAKADQISLSHIIGIEPIYVYNYQGSLTTPPCSENVNWMVATRTLKISDSELNELKKVKFNDGGKILRNYRPTQQMGTRQIVIY
jgi:carbonic anhydrase